MKRKLILGVVLVAVLLVAVLYWCFIVARWKLDRDFAVLILRWLTSFGIFGAVLAALFAEHLRELLFPIDLRIENPNEQESNAVFDKPDFKDDKRYKHLPEILRETFDVYCHHLQVRNLTAYRPIKDCRVWLKKIEIQDAAGNWKVEGPFAVPRMMEWAPAEYSRDKRTFSTKQVFDFGLTLSNNKGFLVTIDRDQGGTFNRLFKVGQKVRFHFYATAEHYQKEKVFCSEVDIPQWVQGQTVTPARVKALQ